MQFSLSTLLYGHYRGLRQHRIRRLATLALLLAGLVALGVGLYGLSVWRTNRNAAAFARAAAQAENEGRHSDAIRSLVACIELVPDSLQTYCRLASLLRETGAADEADECMERLVRSNPKTLRAHLLRGQYLLATNRPVDAEESASNALALAPTDCDALYLGARCAVANDQLALAERRAHQLLDLYPWHAPIYPLMAAYEVGNGRIDLAVVWIDKGLARNPKDSQLLWSYANAMINQNRLTEAEPLVSRYQAAVGQDPRAEFLVARLHHANGRWLAAAASLERLRDTLTWSELRRQADLTLIECYAKLGNPTAQLTAAERAVATEPGYRPYGSALAVARLACGKIDAAILATTPPSMAAADADALNRWMRLRFQRQLSRPFGDAGWRDLLRDCLAAESRFPNRTDLALLAIETQYGCGSTDEATKHCKSVAARLSSLPLTLAQASLACRAGQWEEANRYLAEAQNRWGDSVSLRLSRAALLAMHEPAQADKALAAFRDNTSGLPAGHLPLLARGLARLAESAGSHKAALALATATAQPATPTDSDWFLLLRLAYRAGDRKLAKSMLERIEGSCGRNVTWRFGQAVCLALDAGPQNNGPAEQARQHLAAVLSTRPSLPAALTLAADLAQTLGDPVVAANYRALANRFGPSGTIEMRQVVEQLLQQGLLRDFDALMQAWCHSLRPPLLETASDLPVLAFDVLTQAKSNNHAQTSSPGRPAIWPAALKVLLAQQAAQGKQADAAKLATEAQESLAALTATASSDASAWCLRLYGALRPAKHPDFDVRLLEARRDLPAGSLTSFVLAQALELAGETTLAATEYERWFDSSQSEIDFDRVAEALARLNRQQRFEAMLADLVAGKRRGSDQAVAWARRKSALAKLSDGNARARVEGIHLIQANLQSPAASPKDLSLIATLMASQPGPDWRNEAIRVLEHLQSTGKAGVDEKYLLVRLQLARGRPDVASDQLAKLLASHGDQAALVRGFTADVLARRQLAAAEPWVRWLEANEPTLFTTVRLRAECQLLQNRAAEAIELLTAFPRRDDGQPADRTLRQALVAKALGDMAASLRLARQQEPCARAVAAAEQLWKAISPQSPDTELALAGLWADNGRFADALAIVSRLAETAPPGPWSECLWKLVRAARGEKQSAEIEALLTSSLKKHNRPESLLLASASLATRRGQYAQAEPLLQEVLRANALQQDAAVQLALLWIFQEKRMDEANQLVDRLIESAGPVAPLLDVRGQYWLAKNDPEKAMVAFQQALWQVESPAYYFHLSRAFLALSKPQLADIAMNRARELGLTEEAVHPLERKHLPQPGRTPQS